MTLATVFFKGSDFGIDDFCCFHGVWEFCFESLFCNAVYVFFTCAMILLEKKELVSEL